MTDAHAGSHPVIRALMERGIPVVMTAKGYQIEGFYKSSSIDLIPSGEGFKALARYDEETDINSFDDLVHLNFDWWCRTRVRMGDQKDSYKPGEAWLPEFERLGLIKIRQVTIYEPKNG